MKKFIALFAALFFAASTLAYGATSNASLPPEAAKVKAALLAKLPPGAVIQHIEKSPLFGGMFYEVLLGGQIVYVDKNADYVLAGMIYDLRGDHLRNLTEERLAVLRKVDIAKLPLQYAFKRVKGDGSRKIYIFSDIDCPFCARLENTLKTIDNLTIYTFLFPLDIHPNAASQSKKIWCAKDRAKAWETYYASHKLPDNKGDCDTPLEKIRELATSYGINGTPGIVFPNGEIVNGAVPKQMIEAMLNQK